MKKYQIIYADPPWKYNDKMDMVGIHGANLQPSYSMKYMKECICKEELMQENIYLHLAWCPESYVYKDAVKEFDAANWFQKLFMRDPRKYNNYLWTPPY